MRVLQLLSSTGFFGAENVVMELLNVLKDQGVESYLGVLENKSNAHSEIVLEARKYTDNVKSFPCSGKFDIKSVFKLNEYIKENRIDIIHSHKYKTNLYSLLASISKEIPLISTCHNWISNNYKMRIYEWLDKKMLNKFDRIIAVSDEVKDEILEAGINKHKVLKIRNGVSIERYSDNSRRELLRAEFGIDENMIVVGNIGRLDKNKGVSYLLNAASRLSDKFTNMRLLIVGDGPFLRELSGESKRLGIADKVVFTGFRNDIPKVISAIDIFVLPSLIEGLPMVLLEAMASQKPVVATRVGDIPNVITDKRSGLLVEPGDAGQLKDAIEHLIEERNFSSSIAEQGFEKVKKEYSSRQMASQYLEVYNSVLQGRVNAA